MIKSITISNFKGITGTATFDTNCKLVTIFTGGMNSGKTSFIEAVRVIRDMVLDGKPYNEISNGGGSSNVFEFKIVFNIYKNLRIEEYTYEVKLNYIDKYIEYEVLSKKNDEDDYDPFDDKSLIFFRTTVDGVSITEKGKQVGSPFDKETFNESNFILFLSKKINNFDKYVTDRVRSEISIILSEFYSIKLFTENEIIYIGKMEQVKRVFYQYTNIYLNLVPGDKILHHSNDDSLYNRVSEYVEIVDLNKMYNDNDIVYYKGEFCVIKFNCDKSSILVPLEVENFIYNQSFTYSYRTPFSELSDSYKTLMKFIGILRPTSYSVYFILDNFSDAIDNDLVNRFLYDYVKSHGKTNKYLPTNQLILTNRRQDLDIENFKTDVHKQIRRETIRITTNYV